jgi:hypothetical protein
MRQQTSENPKGQAVEALEERSMKTLVEYIVKALVDDPDQIMIAERTGRNTKSMLPVPVKRSGWYLRLWVKSHRLLIDGHRGLGFLFLIFIIKMRIGHNE